MKDKYCELCAAKGLKRKLKFCRVNFEEGIFLCENDMCVYPFGAAEVDSLLFKTSAAEIVPENPGRKTQPESTEQTANGTSSTSSTPATNFYWTNSDNLCWLDSVMTTLVNNRCLRLCLEKYRPKDSILQQLCTDFNEAQKLGPTEQGRGILQNVRVKVFEFLKTKMQCSLGINDSALESLNALLIDSSAIRERFIQECQWMFRCSSCGYSQVDRHKKLVVTFPNTTDDFPMPSGVFQRACYKCKAMAQRSQLELKRLPPCVMAHFVAGVKNKDFFKNGFVCQGNNYELCQLIQYKRNPDHFIAWVRNCNGTHWAKVDDTENAVCNWTKGIPSFPLDQVYIAVWERAKLYQRKSSSVENSTKSSAEAKRPESRRKVTKKMSKIPKELTENLNEGTSNLISTRDERFHEPFITSEILVGKHRNSNGENVAEGSNETNDQHSMSCNSTKTMEVSVEGIADKRKSNTFEPYIPKKKRALSSSFSLGEGESKAGPEDFTSPTQQAQDKATTDFPQLKGRIVTEKQNQSIVCDNQCDSGYSSPGSNSSCVSLPGHCSKEERLILNELVDTLDEIDELSRTRNCDNTQKADSFHLQPFKGEPRTIPTLGDSSLSCSQNRTKDTGLAKVEFPDHMMDLDWCGDSSVKDVSCGKANDKRNDFDLIKNLDAPCDFPDIDTLSNCGNDLIEELDSIVFVQTGELSDGHTEQEVDLNELVQLSGTIETPNSKDIIDTLGTQESVKLSKCKADNHTSYIHENNDVLSNLQKTMKSIIYSSECGVQLENLTKSENSTSSVQNTTSFLDKTKLLYRPTESVYPPHSDSFRKDRKDLSNDSNVESIRLNEKTSCLSLNEESCDLPSLDLPDITEFVQLQGNVKKDSSTPSADQNSSVQDILEQIFPRKLLDKDTREQSSICERTYITEKNTDFVFGASDMWT